MNCHYNYIFCVSLYGIHLKTAIAVKPKLIKALRNSAFMGFIALITVLWLPTLVLADLPSLAIAD